MPEVRDRIVEVIRSLPSHVPNIDEHLAAVAWLAFNTGPNAQSLVWEQGMVDRVRMELESEMIDVARRARRANQPVRPAAIARQVLGTDHVRFRKWVRRVLKAANLDQPPTKAAPKSAKPVPLVSAPMRAAATAQETVQALLAEAKARYLGGEPIVPADIGRAIGYHGHSASVRKQFEDGLNARKIQYTRRPTGAGKPWDKTVQEAAWQYWQNKRAPTPTETLEIVKAHYPTYKASGLNDIAAKFSAHFERLGYLRDPSPDRDMSGPGPAKDPAERLSKGTSKLSARILDEMLALAAQKTAAGEPIVVSDIAEEAGAQPPFADGDLAIVEQTLTGAGHRFVRRWRGVLPGDRWYKVLRRAGQYHKLNRELTVEDVEDLVARFYASKPVSVQDTQVRLLGPELEALGYLSAAEAAQLAAEHAQPDPVAGRKRRAPAASTRAKRQKTRSAAEEAALVGDGESSDAGTPMDVDTSVKPKRKHLLRSWIVTFGSGGSATLEAVTVPESGGKKGWIDYTGIQPVVGTQADWDTTDLSQAVIAVREDQGIFGLRNGAAFEYRDNNGQRRIEVAFSRRWGSPPHAEQRLWASLAARGIQRDQVTRIYSELQPYTIMPHCGKFLAARFPNVPVTYSFVYQPDTAARLAGVAQLREALRRRFPAHPAAA